MLSRPGGRRRGGPGVLLGTMLAVLVLGVTGCAAIPPARRAATPRPTATAPPMTRVLFVGASVTSGMYASTEPQGYPDLVVQSLDVHRWVDVTRLATSGATVRSALHWNLSVKSDIAIVQMGTNDYLQNVPLASFGRDYRTLLARIRKASPHTVLVCISTWADPAAPNAAGLSGGRYDDVLKKACVAQDGRYVDISGVYTDPSNHGPQGRATYLGPADWFHPNDRGHEAIAFAVLSALSPASGRPGGDTAQLSGATSRSPHAGG